MTNRLYYPPNARTPEQRAKMVTLEEQGICIFCPKHFGVANGRPVLATNGTWSAAENEFPYQGTKHHWLLVPHEHVRAMHLLSPEAQLGYFDLLSILVEQFDLTSYGQLSRNGNPADIGATVTHLHVQLIVPDPEYRGGRIALYLSSARPS